MQNSFFLEGADTYLVTCPGSAPARSTVVFDEAPNVGLAFVHSSGPVTKNLGVQRSIRKHVMRSIGRSRRKDNATDPHDPACLVLLSKNTNASDKGSQQPHHSPDRHRPCLCSTCNTLDTDTHPSAGNAQHHLSADESDLATSRFTTAETCAAISRFATRQINPFKSFPIVMTPQVEGLMHRILDGSDREIRLYRDAMFPLGLSGAASCHQILANLALFMRLLRQDSSEDRKRYETEELMHQTKVFSIINTLIAKKQAVPDDVVIAVVALICHAHSGDNVPAWYTHMNGLKEIVRLRGGIDTFDSSPTLRIIMGCVDITGCCSLDIRPNWSLPVKLMPLGPEVPESIVLPESLNCLIELIDTRISNARVFTDVFLDTAIFGILLEDEDRATSGQVYEKPLFTGVGACINGLLYRLMYCSGGEDGNAEAMFLDACRLSTVLFLAEIRRRLGFFPIRSKLQVSKLWLVLNFGTMEWEGMSDFKLWILTMGLIEADEELEFEWFLSEWKSVRLQQGLVSLQMTTDALRKIMWVEPIHGRKLMELQEQIEN